MITKFMAKEATYERRKSQSEGKYSLSAPIYARRANATRSHVNVHLPKTPTAVKIANNTPIRLSPAIAPEAAGMIRASALWYRRRFGRGKIRWAS
jgi:hypothetical protein